MAEEYEYGERRLSGLKPWKPGQSGNPSGRPKDPAKQSFPRQFLGDLRQAWLAHGPEALAKAARDQPVAFVKVAASLIPREVILSPGTGEAGSFLSVLATARAAELGEPPPDSDVIEGETVQPCAPAHADAQPVHRDVPEARPSAGDGPASKRPLTKGARKRSLTIPPPPPLEPPTPPDGSGGE